MTAQLIDGVALSRKIREEVAQRAAALTARGHQPGLAVILVGDDPASATYVKNKVKACADAGVHSVLEKYDAALTETWRDEAHEEETLRFGEVVEDLRAA